MPDIKSESYQKTIAESLEKCAVAQGEVDVINTHGLGASLIDQYEANAITSVFGEYLPKPFITAFKPYFGHTLGNCALLETIILLLSMKENLILPILNFKGEDPKIHITINQEKMRAELTTGMKIVWGFGGYSAATIFRKIY